MQSVATQTEACRHSDPMKIGLHFHFRENLYSNGTTTQTVIRADPVPKGQQNWDQVRSRYDGGGGDVAQNGLQCVFHHNKHAHSPVLRSHSRLQTGRAIQNRGPRHLQAHPRRISSGYKDSPGRSTVGTLQPVFRTACRWNHLQKAAIYSACLWVSC